MDGRGVSVAVASSSSITSLPYADTTIGVHREVHRPLGDAIDEGNLAGIVAYNDESSDGATRITLGLASGVAAEQVIPALLRWTNLQVTNKVQMHFLDEHGSVRLYNLRSCIQAWIDHRVRVIIRRSENRLEKIDDRLHRLRGFLAVLIDIDRDDRDRAHVEDPGDRPHVAHGRVRHRRGPGQRGARPQPRSAHRGRRHRVQQGGHRAARRRRPSCADSSASPTALRRQVGTELEEVIPQFDGVAPRVTTIATEVAQRVSKAAMVLDEPVTVMVDANGYVQARAVGFEGQAEARAAALVRHLDRADTWW